jgi:drug/metabolite transporter (DMT)-like permease
MYPYLIGITLLKSLNPYFRKHILDTLEGHDLLFINTFFIFLIVFAIFIYKTIFHNSLYDTIENYKNLSNTQILCIFLICALTVGSSILLYELDKNFNTPLLNFMFLKFASVLSLIFVGIFIFKEKYTWKQILGIVLTICGIYLITNKE